MKIAIPYEDGRLNGHFGGCREFALVEIDPDKKAILRTDVVPAPEHQPGLFPRWLRQQGVTVVIVGGIGRRALDIFAEEGIEVRAGNPGASVDELVTTYLSGQRTLAPDACGQQGHPNEHGHGHQHHHGHCHEEP